MRGLPVIQVGDHTHKNSNRFWEGHVLLSGHRAEETHDE
jgi:hypothetical protein